MKTLKKFLFIAFSILLLSSCESEQVRMGRKALKDYFNNDIYLKDGKVKGETYTVISNGNVYWELEYHFLSGALGTQVIFAHFMTNGTFVKDVNIKEYESKTGKKATKAKSENKQLPPLALEKGLYNTTYINRALKVYDKAEFIQISPDIKAKKDGIYLIVKSSFADGGYNTTLTFGFLYGEKAYDNDLVLKSNEETNNDKSISYYDLTQEQIDILKNNKLASVRIQKYSDMIYCLVNKNLEPYFKEYFSLKEVEQVLQVMEQ